MNLIKNNWFLIIILILAFILRFIGIFYAYPLPLISDETPTLLACLKMIGTQSLIVDAKGYYYPPVLAYIYLPFFVIFLFLGKILGIFINNNQLKEIVLLNSGVFIPLARFITVIFGTATVLLIYLICQKLFNKKIISLLAALFLAVSFFHVGNSHLAQTWTVQVFFILLVLFWAINLISKSEDNYKDYLLGGLLVGMAFGVNFVGIISYFWLILAHFLINKQKGFLNIFIKNKKFWLANLVIFFIILLFYLLNPFGLNNYFHRLTDTSTPVVFGGQAVYKIFQLATLTSLFFYLKNVFILEPFLFILSIIGSFILWKKQKIAFYFLTLWLIIYYLLLSPLTNAINRYALPVLPIMTIISAYLIIYLLKNIFNKKIIYILLFLLIFYSLLFDFLFDWRMLKQDTRLLARDWILENIPSGSIIKNNYLNESLALVENRENIEFLQKNFPEMISTKRKYLLDLKGDSYPKPNYFLIMYDYDKRVNLNLKYNYIILSSFDKNKIDELAKDISNNYDLVVTFYPISKNFKGKFPVAKELEVPYNNREFSSWSLLKLYEYYGPYIEIYQSIN